jgi:hypothetical protein
MARSSVLEIQMWDQETAWRRKRAESGDDIGREAKQAVDG